MLGRWQTCAGLRVCLVCRQVRAELDRARVDLEQEGRSTQIGKLCATPFGVDIVGITELVALIGALVGGAQTYHPLRPQPI